MGDKEFINKEKIITIVNQVKIKLLLPFGNFICLSLNNLTSGFAQNPDPEDIFKKYKKS
jgi:hypothetical protein